MTGNRNVLTRVSLGAAGGLAGTLALQGLMAAQGKWRPDTLPPLRQDPGEFMVEQAEAYLLETVQEHIPEVVETVAARGLALGYGLTFGALYAALRPNGGNALADGAVLGLACWAAGYAGWLPALGLMPPFWQQRAAQALAAVAEHMAYGVVCVAAYDWLCDRMDG
jgi:hypothetical protein